MKRTSRITWNALLTPSLLLRRGEEQTFHSLLNRSEVKIYIFYSYGRVALLDGLRILGCKEGSNVLLPSYICGVAVEPFRELGIEPRFYEVSLNLQPDIKDVKSKIDDRTEAILIVNYFGFVQNLKAIYGICRQKGLYLIEDNAHGFLSRNGSRLLGTCGDIGFSSICKTLPTPDGAILFINNEKLLEGKEKIERARLSQNRLPQTSKRKIYTYILNSLLGNLELRYRFRAEFIRNIYRKLFPEAELSSSQLFQDSKHRVSEVSLRIARNIDLEGVYNRRRQNYNFWLSVLCNREDVHILFRDLPDGICPLFFAVIEEEADSFVKEMQDKGVQAYHWPPLPEEIKGNPEYPNANFLAEHLVTLPVQQNLNHDCLAGILG